ncbi:MAG TPA: hypothetical protein VN712_05090, partial [Dermatophilaceae bacterium]|nr:hypothetical protein [Dermatophilaceae bacterium]
MGTTYDDWKTTPPGDDEPDVEACGHRVGTCEGECRLEEDDYCYTCGGAHPTSTHDTGRVIRLAADTEPAPALEEES